MEFGKVKMLIKILFMVNYSNLQIFGNVCCKKIVFSFYGAPKTNLELQLCNYREVDLSSMK